MNHGKLSIVPKRKASWPAARCAEELCTNCGRNSERKFSEIVPDTPRFPLLIKILDAQEKLSLQVHPPENIASKLGGEPKSEFWYVAAANPDAEVFVGFREPITRDTFEEKLRNGTVIDYIHKIAVQAGDAIFLPAGRVHAIGAGNLLIEIQQNSDTTYRVFDWNRTDPATGTKRDLHIQQAIQCIDFEDVQPKLIQSEGELLISHSLFEIRKWNLDEAREAAPLGQFAIVCCLTGNLSCAKVEACARRIFSNPSPFGGSATETTRARHKSVAQSPFRCRGGRVGRKRFMPDRVTIPKR